MTMQSTVTGGIWLIHERICGMNKFRPHNNKGLIARNVFYKAVCKILSFRVTRAMPVTSYKTSLSGNKPEASLRLLFTTFLQIWNRFTKFWENTFDNKNYLLAAATSSACLFLLYRLAKQLWILPCRLWVQLPPKTNISVMKLDYQHH